MYVLLGILAILLLVLFMPIFYRVEGSFGAQTVIYAKVSWFFRLFRATYEESVFTMKIGPYALPTDRPAKPPKPPKFGKKPKQKVNIKSLLTNLDIKSIISLGIIFMKKLFKKIAPSHFQVRGVVGFANPCTTGQFMGLYEAAAHAMGLRKAIDLQGNFCQEHFELDVKMSGCFAIAPLLGIMIWFILQKPVRAAFNRRQK